MTVVQAIFNFCICYFTSMTMDHNGVDLVTCVLYPESNAAGNPKVSHILRVMPTFTWQVALSPVCRCSHCQQRGKAGSSLIFKSSEEPGHRMGTMQGLWVALLLLLGEKLSFLGKLPQGWGRVNWVNIVKWDSIKMPRFQFFRNYSGLSTWEVIETCDSVLLSPQPNTIIFSLKQEGPANPVGFIA